MGGIPEAVRARAYDRWGRVCFICDAAPQPPTLAQRAWGQTELRIALHHLNDDGADHRVANLLPVCESAEQGDGCHAAIHCGGGRRLHRFFHRRLRGELSEAEAVQVMRLLSGE